MRKADVLRQLVGKPIGLTFSEGTVEVYSKPSLATLTFDLTAVGEELFEVERGREKTYYSIAHIRSITFK